MRFSELRIKSTVQIGAEFELATCYSEDFIIYRRSLLGVVQEHYHDTDLIWASRSMSGFPY